MATTTYESFPRAGGDSADRLARGLGWFSIALGAAEILAPDRLARALGMPGRAPVFGAYGVREIATGIGILTSNDPRPWLSARVAGDALDLATLATGLGGDNPHRRNVGLAMAAVAGVTVLDVMCREQLQTESAPQTIYDYSDRSGFPRPPDQMRGAARDAAIPRDMLTPEPLQPYATIDRK